MIEEYKPGVISVMDNSVYSRVVVTKIKHILMNISTSQLQFELSITMLFSYGYGQ